MAELRCPTPLGELVWWRGAVGLADEARLGETNFFETCDRSQASRTARTRAETGQKIYQHHSQQTRQERGQEREPRRALIQLYSIFNPPS